uniref:Uncharacterized protein n=1 Tax=Oxyrrhis marina TaxID=2969 RepID=A0A7S4GN07_OXYMA
MRIWTGMTVHSCSRIRRREGDADDVGDDDRMRTTWVMMTWRRTIDSFLQEDPAEEDNADDAGDDDLASEDDDALMQDPEDEGDAEDTGDDDLASDDADADVDTPTDADEADDDDDAFIQQELMTMMMRSSSRSRRTMT